MGMNGWAILDPSCWQSTFLPSWQDYLICLIGGQPSRGAWTGRGRGQREHHAVQPRQMPRHCLGYRTLATIPPGLVGWRNSSLGMAKTLSGSELNRGQQQGPKHHVWAGSRPESQGRDGLSPFAKHFAFNIWVLHPVLGPCSTGKHRL